MSRGKSGAGAAARETFVWGLGALLAWGCAGAEGGTEPVGSQDEVARLLTARQRPIVFVSERDQAGVGDVYLMAEDGSGVERLTTGGNYFVPHWAPGGDAIAFRRVGAVTAGVGVLGADNGTPVLLADGEDPTWRYSPLGWSADGQRVIYASDREEARLTLWEVPLSGSQRSRLFPEVEAVQNGVDGEASGERRVLFTGGESLEQQDLWLSSGAAAPRNLTNGRVFAPIDPRWSPDGRQIAFAAYPRLPDGSVEGLGDHTAAVVSTPDSEIFILDVDTGALRRLTDDPYEYTFPSWAPDGKSLLVTANRDGDGDLDLWLLRLDESQEPRNLTPDGAQPRDDLMGDWLRDPR